MDVMFKSHYESVQWRNIIDFFLSCAQKEFSILNAQ